LFVKSLTFLGDPAGMKLNQKAQQVIEYLLIVVAVVGGVLAMAGPLRTSVETTLDGTVKTIYQGYTWRAGPAQTCSVTCGVGTATRSVWCEGNESSQPVGDAFCSGPKPAETVSCNAGSCGQYIWQIGTFGACQPACGDGTQTRSVVCMDVGTGPVPFSFCPGSPPLLSQPCNDGECYFWETGAIGLCSEPCGVGTAPIDVKCKERLTGNTVLDSNCSGLRPSGRITCDTGSSCGYQWITSGWSGCNPQCGPGVKTQNVQCVRVSDGQVQTNETLCNAAQKPDGTAACNLGACYNWNLTGGWGPCSTVCDAGTQNALVQCVDRQGGVVADDLCDLASRPLSTRACSNQPVCTYSWGNDAWSTCSVNCGTGTQTRNVFCDRTFPPQVRMPNLDECRRVDPAGEPPASQTCTGPCYQWVSTPWSACNNTCGVGTEFRTYQCKDSNGNGAVVANTNCLAAVGAPPTTSQPCTGTTSCCGNGTCNNFPAVGYVENCANCNQDCFTTLCPNDGFCWAGETCANSASDCNTCGNWANGSCGVNGGCPDGYRKQTRSCVCAGVQGQCVRDTACDFRCTGGMSVNSTSCGTTTGLTSSIPWSYGGCDGTKCRAYCNSGYYASGGTCLASVPQSSCSAGALLGYTGWGRETYIYCTGVPNQVRLVAGIPGTCYGTTGTFNIPTTFAPYFCTNTNCGACYTIYYAFSCSGNTCTMTVNYGGFYQTPANVSFTRP
jgi:hypothetical protein